MAVLAPLLALMLFASQPPAPAPSESGDKPKGESAVKSAETEAGDQNAQRPVSPVDQPVAEEHTQGPAQSSGQQQERTALDAYDTLLICFTGLLTLFTGVLSIFAWRQWLVSRDSHRLNEIVQRPWVNLWTLHLTPFRPWTESKTPDEARFQPDLPITAVMGFRNSGGTPAFIVDAHITHRVYDQMPTTLDFDNLPRGVGVPKILVRDEETNWRHPLIKTGFAQNDYDAIRQGKKLLLIWGEIAYRQTKDETGTLRVTKFARVFDPTVDKPLWGARFAFPDIEGCNDAT